MALVLASRNFVEDNKTKIEQKIFFFFYRMTKLFHQNYKVKENKTKMRNTS